MYTGRRVELKEETVFHRDGVEMKFPKDYKGTVVSEISGVWGVQLDGIFGNFVSYECDFVEIDSDPDSDPDSERFYT